MSANNNNKKLKAKFLVYIIKLTVAIEKTRLQSGIMMVITNSYKQFQKLNLRKLASYKIY